MAAKPPAEVAAILAKIETDNPSLMGDMLRAALVLPPDVGTSLVPAICQAARKDSLWIYFKNAVDFCLRLAEGEHPDAAMTLAVALFAPAFENGEEKRTRDDQYWYKDVLKK